MYRLRRIKKIYLLWESAFVYKKGVTYAPQSLLYLEDMGVKPEDVILEQHSRTTRENILNLSLINVFFVHLTSEPIWSLSREASAERERIQRIHFFERIDCVSVHYVHYTPSGNLLVTTNFQERSELKGVGGTNPDFTSGRLPRRRPWGLLLASLIRFPDYLSGYRQKPGANNTKPLPGLFCVYSQQLDTCSLFFADVNLLHRSTCPHFRGDKTSASCSGGWVVLINTGFCSACNVFVLFLYSPYSTCNSKPCITYPQKKSLSLNFEVLKEIKH